MLQKCASTGVTSLQSEKGKLQDQYASAHARNGVHPLNILKCVSLRKNDKLAQGSLQSLFILCFAAFYRAHRNDRQRACLHKPVAESFRRACEAPGSPATLQRLLFGCRSHRPRSNLRIATTQVRITTARQSSGSLTLTLTAGGLLEETTRSFTLPRLWRRGWHSGRATYWRSCYTLKCASAACPYKVTRPLYCTCTSCQLSRLDVRQPCRRLSSRSVQVVCEGRSSAESGERCAVDYAFSLTFAFSLAPASIQLPIDFVVPLDVARRVQ